jgi:hypothetical protein
VRNCNESTKPIPTIECGRSLRLAYGSHPEANTI